MYYYYYDDFMAMKTIKGAREGNLINDKFTYNLAMVT